MDQMQQGLSVTLQMALNIAMLIVAALGGWVAKMLFDRLDKLEKADEKQMDAITSLREELPKRYAPKDDVERLGDKLFEALRRIEDKLDKKADR
jgi:hypothetical protein